MAFANSIGALNRPKKLLIQPSVNSPFCVSPSQLQEVTLDLDATDLSYLGSKSPSALANGRTVKEIDEQLSALKKENFNLKLRLYFIEERMGSHFNVDNEDAIQKNIELQFELANIQKELDGKQELLCQAAKVMEIEEEERKKELTSKEQEICNLKGKMEEMQLQLEKGKMENTNHGEFWTEAFNLSNQSTSSADLVKKLQGRINDLQNELKREKDHTNKMESAVENAQIKCKNLESQVTEKESKLSIVSAELENATDKLHECMIEVDGLKEELLKKSCTIDSLSKMSSKKEIEINDVKLQLREIQNLYDSLIVRSDGRIAASLANSDQSCVGNSLQTTEKNGSSKGLHESSSLLGNAQLSQEEVMELKKNHFKACKIIKTMIHKKKEYTEQIEKLQNLVKEGKDEIESLKKEQHNIISHVQLEPSKVSIKDKVSELNLTAGWQSTKESLMVDIPADLTTRYKELVCELEKKIEILHATLEQKNNQIERLNLDVQEKANSIIDLEFELLAHMESVNEREPSDEKEDTSKENLLEEKEEIIKKLENELRKRTGDLQGIVNKELWEKNRTIEKLQMIIKGKEEAMSKIEKTNSNTELQLKLLKQRINELGININIPIEMVSLDVIDPDKEKDYQQLYLESEKMRRDCQEICRILNGRLEELCHFLQSLLRHKSVLGFLGHQQSYRLLEAVNKSLELSQEFSSTILIGVNDSTLTQLCNITNLLNSTRNNSITFNSFTLDDDNSILSIIPSDITLTYRSHLISNNNEGDIIKVLREQVTDLNREIELRDVELEKLRRDSFKYDDTNVHVDQRRTSNGSSHTIKMQNVDQQSESESWSEPDRDVSFARIGLQGDSLKCINVSLNNKTQSKRNVLAEYKQTITLLHEEVSKLGMKLKGKEEQLGTIQMAYGDCEKELSLERNKLSEIRELYENSLCDIEKLKANISKLHLGTRATTLQLETSRAEKLQVQQQLNELKVTVASLEECKRNLSLIYDTKSKEMQNTINEMEIEKTRAIQMIHDLELKLMTTAKCLELRETEMQQQAVELKNLQDKEHMATKDLCQSREVITKLTNQVEQLQNTNQESCLKILQLEGKIEQSLKQLDDVTLKNSELVLEKTKLKNDYVILENNMAKLNTKESTLRISNLKLIESQLIDSNKTQVSKHILSSSLPNDLHLQNGTFRTSKNHIFDVMQRDNEEYRLNNLHSAQDILEIMDDNDRLHASCSPDLGIESDQGRLSSLENNICIPRPLLPSLQIAQAVNNLLDSVENNHCNDQHCNKQRDQLTSENAELHKRLLRTRRALDETLTRLTLANKQKKEVEKSICKQIHKTSQVLRKAKANLDSGSET